jgi:hypothetical protein
MTGQPPFEQPQPPYQPPYQQPQYPQYPPPGPAQGGPPGPQPGWTEPMDAAQAAAARQYNAPVLVTIGDIVCTRNEVITPSGRAPIGGVVWSFTDLSRTTRSIPTWAIVCAVIFFGAPGMNVGVGLSAAVLFVG